MLLVYDSARQGYEKLGALIIDYVHTVVCNKEVDCYERFSRISGQGIDTN